MIVKHSESLGLMHQKQIDRNQEHLKEVIAEFERLRTFEKRRLEESVRSLDQEFHKVLVRLQEEFVSLAHEASEKLKTDVRNCKRQYDKKLENRARELAVELQSASFRSDMLLRNGAPISPKNQENREARLGNLAMMTPKGQEIDLDWLEASESSSMKKDCSLSDRVDYVQNRQTSPTDRENTDNDDENIINRALGLQGKTAYADLKSSYARRQALGTSRRQIPDFKSKEIAFVKGRLRVLMQSIEKFSNEDISI